MISRKRCLVAGAALLLSLVPHPARSADPPIIALTCRDAPVRSVLELVLGLEGKSYQLDAGVSGLVTLKLAGTTFPDAMNRVTQGATTPLTWRESPPNLVVVGKKPAAASGSFEIGPVPRDFARLAAVATRGRVRKAILELGSPPDSNVSVVEVGSVVCESTGKKWKVHALAADRCDLRAPDGATVAVFLKALPRAAR